MTPDTAADYWPAWSRDGARIAFMSDPPPYAAHYNVAVIDSDGTGRDQLTNEASFIGFPAWSPSGARIAITIGVPVGSSNIFTIASDGTDREQLTDGVAFSHSATWSPGGGRLVYCADGHIYIMNGDGTNRTYVARSSEALGFYACTADWGS